MWPRRAPSDRLRAAAVVVAAAAAALLAGCGGGTPADETRRAVAAACDRHAAALPAPVPATAGPAAVDRTALGVLAAFNATDAALDAAPASGDTAGRVEALREAALGMRDAVTTLRNTVRSEDDAAVAPARARAAAAMDLVDARAAGLGVAACASAPLGRRVVESLGAAAGRRAAARTPTGDYRRDLARACRTLPGDLSVPARYRRGPDAQSRALTVRQALQAFEARLRELDPGAGRAAAHRAALRDIERAEEVLLGYVETVGVGDPEGARLAAGEANGLVMAARARLAALAGGPCRA